jgi:hypothetical protein
MNMDEKIIRVFARKTKWTPTDDLVFYDEPPIYDLPDLPVYISATFSWDRDKALLLFNAWAKKFKKVCCGGPAFGTKIDGFIAGRFIKKGVTFTSRGCPKKCPWCLVPEREGKLTEINIEPGYIVQDNNLLACSRGHIERVFDMLRGQKRGIKFSGGLDIDYLQSWHLDLLKTIKINELWVACDQERDLPRLDKAKDLLSDFPLGKKRCYVLCFYNGDSMSHAEKRLEAVYEKGFLPFAQPYKSPDAEYEWCIGDDCFERAKLIRKWQRPAIYRKRKFEKNMHQSVLIRG